MPERPVASLLRINTIDAILQSQQMLGNEPARLAYQAGVVGVPTPAGDGVRETNVTASEHSTDQYLYRMSSTSEEDDQNENAWQNVRSTKRRKINNQNIENQNLEVPINNRFSPLTTEDDHSQNNTAKKIPRPPPIFVYGVINFPEMIKKLSEIVAEEQYITKSMPDNTIKINCNTPDTYRILVRFMRENNIVHHTYQLKEERAFRVVIKHLHHTIDPEDIKEELTKEGHQVRNVMNGRHRITKEPLNMFFVDLEPASNNKDIYDLVALQNKVVHVEPPRTQRGLIQCTKCQQYGHTKTYCNRPFVCVKCGGPHNTSTCKKTRDTPAKCALCDGPHPANYKGCEFYQSLVKSNNANNRLNIQKTGVSSLQIKRLIAVKRRARAKWQRTHAPVHKRAYNLAAQKLKDEIKKSSDISIQNYLSNLNRFDNSIWKPIKSLKKPKTPVPPVRRQTNDHTQNWARSDKEKADLFAQYLADVFTPNNNEPDQEITEQINRLPLRIPLIKLITPKEIKSEISKLCIKKAP
ncbi:unnamed protein product, partial [Callosobruchus maculatus]